MSASNTPPVDFGSQQRSKIQQMIHAHMLSVLLMARLCAETVSTFAKTPKAVHLKSQQHRQKSLVSANPESSQPQLNKQAEGNGLRMTPVSSRLSTEANKKTSPPRTSTQLEVAALSSDQCGFVTSSDGHIYIYFLMDIKIYTHTDIHIYFPA